MGTPESIDWDALNEPQEIAHDFEIDLHMLVRANHEFTITAIDREEDEELAKIDNDFHAESYETVRSIRAQLQNTYEDFRRAARLLALVGLVTRLDHWISRFARWQNLTGLKQSKPREPKLVTQLNALNQDLGSGISGRLNSDSPRRHRFSSSLGDSPTCCFLRECARVVYNSRQQRGTHKPVRHWIQFAGANALYQRVFRARYANWDGHY